MLCLLGFSGCDKPPEKSVLDGKWKTAPKSLSKDSDSPDLSQNVDYMPRKVLDVSRLAATGWSPRIGLDEGIG
jgi:nucleoside-diphosphate-sugar epimerase